MTPVDLDATDLALLAALQKDGRSTNADLARHAHLSESACLRRVRLLEQRGVIERYGAIINQRAVGLPLTVFITIGLTEQSEAALLAFEKEIATVPEVMECYLMTGSSDFLVRVVARDVDDLARIHSNRLTRLTGVSHVNSSLALQTIVKRTSLPLSRGRGG
jgi:DNA-binding Lrp family transcriptional regulator